MKPFDIFKKVLSVVFFIVLVYYIYYFNLLPIRDWLGEISFLTTVLSPARDLSGQWIGTAPQGAEYRDYVINYACSYEADLTLAIKQKGQNINGSAVFKVRRSVQRLKRIPCLPKNYSFEMPINGTVSETDVEFSNPGIPDTYSPMTFSGKFTDRIMSGTFERLPSNKDLAGLKGEWHVTKK